MQVQFGRSQRLERFIKMLNILSLNEVFKSNHPTENKDRRDFAYKKIRIITEIDGEFIFYYLSFEKFLNNEYTTWIHLQTFKKIFRLSELDMNTKFVLWDEVKLFEKEIEKLNRLPLIERAKRKIKKYLEYSKQMGIL